MSSDQNQPFAEIEDMRGCSEEEMEEQFNALRARAREQGAFLFAQIIDEKDAATGFGRFHTNGDDHGLVALLLESEQFLILLDGAEPGEIAPLDLEAEQISFGALRVLNSEQLEIVDGEMHTDGGVLWLQLRGARYMIIRADWLGAARDSGLLE